LLGEEEGLWEPIDYSYFSEEDLAAIPEDQMREFGFGNIYYSQIIGYDKRAFPEDGPFPENYVDFWDLEKFPGMRALPSCTNPWEALPEAAILSTGAAPEDVYPIDIDLALEQIKKIAPNTIFWDSPAVAAQLLTDQQVVMAQAPNGRIKVLISAGVPLDIVWDQARIQSDFWFVIKDAPNKENAMKFLAFAARPEQQAIMAKLTAYPPINPLMYDYVDEATAKLLPNYPDNLAVSYPASHEWWAEYRDEWAERCTEALLE
jgi:putative spermidine/putrescine transport system substrate-binding protein